MLKLIVAVIAVLGFAGSVFAQTPPPAAPQDNAAMTQPAPAAAAPKAEKKAKKVKKYAKKHAKKAKVDLGGQPASEPAPAPAPAAK